MSVETLDYIAMLRRMIRAAGKRCAEADEVELAALIEVEADLRQAIDTAVQGMRSRGVTWAYIALATGTTRQAAQMRWGRAS